MGLSIYILTFIFIIGLVVGSFLNVVILRTVSEESIVFPGSKCPKCQSPLKWYHNIPLFSYLFLRGKCAYCKEHISWQYPFVEFLTGCVFVGLFIKFCAPFDPAFGLSMMNDITFYQLFNYLFSLIISCLFIVISGTDFLEMRCSSIHLYSLIGIGLIYGLFLTILNPENQVINLSYILTSPLICSIVATIIGFASMEIYRFTASKLVGTEAHGDGDAYIAGGIGAYIGSLIAYAYPFAGINQVLWAMLWIIIGAVIIMSVIGMPMFLKNIFKDKLAFTSLVALVLYSLGLRYLSEWVDDNIWMTIISLVVFLGLCIFFVREVLKGIREHRSNGIPCPFGPPLCIAGFIAILLINLSV